MAYLDYLTKEDILYMENPIDTLQLLNDSCFYPACGSYPTDGRPIKYCNTIWRRLGINSFVYCDFLAAETILLNELNHIAGYHVFAHRPLRKEEYMCKDWKLVLSPDDKYSDTFDNRPLTFKPFCHWAIMERNQTKSCLHGPKRFSILFIGGEGPDGGEGVKTYQHLYCSRNLAPKLLVLSSCWGAFSGNHEDWASAKSSLHHTFRTFRQLPEYICVGDCGRIYGGQRVANSQFMNDVLKVRFLGYDLYSHEKGILVDASLFHNIRVIQRDDGRKFLKLTCSTYDIAPLMYDITRSPYDLNTIVENLMLPEVNDNPSPGEVLNGWIGFKAPVETCFAGVRPNLSLEIRKPDAHKNPMVADAIAVAKAVFRMCQFKHHTIYTQRMMDYLLSAQNIIESQFKAEPDNTTLDWQVMKIPLLIRYLEQFCKKVD
jgi:hypothetical protein